MRKITPFLLAAALVVGVAAFAPVPAQADIWCDQCDIDPNDCFACCKCAGGTTYYCAAFVCGAPGTMLPEVPFDISVDGEACVADQDAETADVEEAPANDEAPDVDESVKTAEPTPTATE